jgi:hypothetical protein
MDDTLRVSGGAGGENDLHRFVLVEGSDGAF